MDASLRCDKHAADRPRPRYRVEPGHDRQYRDRVYSDASSPSSQNSRRVLFKNNVSVYRFDSDGEDNANGYSSAVSEDSEQLDGRPRYHRHHHQRNRPQPKLGLPGVANHDRLPSQASLDGDAATSWAVARGWGPADCRTSRYSTEDTTGDDCIVDNLRAVRLGPNSTGHARAQRRPMDRTLYAQDHFTDAKRRGGGQTLMRVQTAEKHVQGVGSVLSCGSLPVQNSVFIDRAHYQHIEGENGFTKHLVLTCSLRYIDDFNPDSIVVKANRNGNRARVDFGTKVKNCRTVVEQSDELLLPFIVDPYRLTAKLQGDNTLVIEAPISS